ncbi:MAG: winged helix-turn-helix domain-containing protein [Alphaproteobacteria bacterium]|nr:winged helix-turn-helix domain-containing protein [Alphaproteobacteria bacterium]
MKNIYIYFADKIISEKFFNYLKNYFNNVFIFTDKADTVIASIIITDLIGFKENFQKLKNTQILLLCAAEELKGIHIAENIIHLNIPIKMDELTAVLEQKSFAAANVYRYKNYVLDINNNVLFKEDVPIALSEKESLILKEFFNSPNKIITKEYFLSAVWNINNTDVHSQSLESYVSALRKKFQDSNINLTISKEKEGYILM